MAPLVGVRQAMVTENTRPRREQLFQGLRPITRAGAVRDGLAGFTLAAMNVPQALGYTRIAGTPVVTGLYTLLLPLVAFATLGSSRYLVVAADSATAAILAGGLSLMAPIASPHYVELAGMVALLSAGFLFLARIFELGFLADFLSETVLVGFLTGVGFQVGIAMLGEMLGITVKSDRSVEQLVEVVRGLPTAHIPTVWLAAAVVMLILILHRVAPRFPGALIAAVGAIVASEVFDFGGHGIALIEQVSGGLPRIGLPKVSGKEVISLIPVAGSCFVMIVSQSAATARAYASRHRDSLDENRDLVGLSAANAAAALSGTFVVNGSPTQTAMVERAGGRSQLAHIATAAIVAVVLLFLTGPLHYLPKAVLAAIVFTIAVGLVDLKGLREIRSESPGEFELAALTAAVVVLVGVEQGILLAIALSLLRHVRHSYRPHTAVLFEHEGHWETKPAVSGESSAPGLLIFQFGADLFYANAARFVNAIRGLVSGAKTPIKHLVLDAGAITSIDYSAAHVVRDQLQDLAKSGISLHIVHAETSLLSDLHRHRLFDLIGRDHIYGTLHEALDAINQRGLD
jgi:sulfate permease, SulP family